MARRVAGAGERFALPRPLAMVVGWCSVVGGNWAQLVRVGADMSASVCAWAATLLAPDTSCRTR